MLLMQLRHPPKEIITCYCCLSAEWLWGVVLILNSTILISSREREELLGITPGYFLERSSSSMKLSACSNLQGNPYGIIQFLPSRGRKNLPVFSPAVVSRPPPTPGAGGIPVFGVCAFLLACSAFFLFLFSRFRASPGISSYTGEGCHLGGIISSYGSPGPARKLVQSSLVNTLPKTKKGKYTAVTEAHKECT